MSQDDLLLPNDDRVRRDIEALLKVGAADDYLLPGDLGGYWSKNSFYHAFSVHLERSELSDEVTPHWLRHTVATYLSQEMTVFDLKTWLGHKSTRTTELYVHAAGDVLGRAMESHPLKGEVER